MAERKVKTIIIDSITGMLDIQYIKQITTRGKPNYDKWMNWGAELLEVYHKITSEFEWEIVQIIGKEGTGKTRSIKYLDPETTVIFDFDSKPFSFTMPDGKRPEVYYNKENKNRYKPKSMEQLKSYLEAIHSKGHTPRVFILGHVDTYKDKSDMISERLRIIGAMGNKHNLEGSTVTCLYTEIRNQHDDDFNRYTFLTKNTGFNTARSIEGMFPRYIPNDYLLVNDILDGKKTKDDIPDTFLQD